MNTSTWSLLEKHYTMLKDLEVERRVAEPQSGCWTNRLDEKIVDLKAAIKKLES